MEDERTGGESAVGPNGKNRRKVVPSLGKKGMPPTGVLNRAAKGWFVRQVHRVRGQPGGGESFFRA